MRLLQSAHGGHVTAPVTDGLLRSMRAAFATNTAIGVRSVASVDDVVFRTDDPVVTALREAYAGVPPERLQGRPAPSLRVSLARRT